MAARYSEVKVLVDIALKHLPWSTAVKLFGEMKEAMKDSKNKSVRETMNRLHNEAKKRDDFWDM